MHPHRDRGCRRAGAVHARVKNYGDLRTQMEAEAAQGRWRSS